MNNNNFTKVNTSATLKLFALLFTLIFISSTSLFAQQDNKEDTLKFFYGGYLGYNLNIHSAKFQLLATECPTCIPEDYGTQFGGGFAFGGLFEYLMYSDGKRTPMRIGARLGYSDVGATFLHKETFGNTEQVNYEGTLPVIAHHNLKAKLSQINFAPYFAYTFLENIVANAGLNFGFLVGSSFDQ